MCKRSYILHVVWVWFVSVGFVQAQAPKAAWAAMQALSVSYTTQAQSLQTLAAPMPDMGVVTNGVRQVARAYSNYMLGPQQWHRYRPDGSLVWSLSWPGNARAFQMRTGASGKIYTTGIYLDSVRLSPQHVLLSQNSNTLGAYLACLNSNGQVLWVKNLTQQYGDVRNLEGLALDGQENIYFSYALGITGGTFIQKYDSAGNQLQTLAHTGVDRIYSLDVDAAGNLFVSGACVKAAGGVFAGTTFVPAVNGNGYNKFIARYRPSGTVAWVKFVGDVTCPDSQVKADKARGVYWVGSLKSNDPFGQHAVNGPLTGSSADYFISRLDSSGNFLWVRDLPSAQSANGAMHGMKNFLEVDSANNLLIAGYLKGSINWGNGIQTTAGITPQLFVQQCSPAGLMNWVKHSVGASATASAHSLAQAADGSLYLTGLARGAIALDSVTVPGAGADYYVVVARLGAALRITGSPAETTFNHSLAVFPNPATDAAFLQLPEALPACAVSLHDLAGRAVKVFERKTGETLQLDLATVQPGLYLLKVEWPDGSRVLKLYKN